jgi:aryl-alcohol dehydrogenase-like predicted oxidoreductase
METKHEEVRAPRLRKIGGSELEVSAIGLGCNNFGWRLDADQTASVVDAAIAAGVTLFDTAENYGNWQSETFLGRALRGRRDDAVIATKFGWDRGGDDDPTPRGSRAYVRRAIDASLTRLGTDYVDLYQYHRPDGVTPIEETLGAMNELVVEGKVRYIGSSNLSAAEVREADAVAEAHGFAKFVSAQNEYSWLERGVEDELIPACAELGIGVIPYFPLAGGLLTGKYRRHEEAPKGTRLADSLDVDEATWNRIAALEAFATERDLGLLDVAIGGLAGNPTVASVIAGATSPEQVRANAAAAAWQPTHDDLTEIRALTS